MRIIVDKKIKTASEIKTNTARLFGDISDAINNNHTQPKNKKDSS
jgi:hypothetical protein